MNDTQYRYELLFQHCHEVEAQRDELLAACKNLLAFMDQYDLLDWDLCNDDQAKIDAARAAIAKAEGEQ